MAQNYLNKYFQLIEENLSKNLNTAGLSELDKEGIKYRLYIINELKGNLSWHVKSPIDKQVGRIRTLANMRRSEDLPHYIAKQETAIKVYDLINGTTPYIDAINSGDINRPIIDFCSNLCDKIDFAGSSYRGSFPKIGELEKVFKVFLEVVVSAQGNGGMFKECYEKIEHLYNELKAISETT